MSAFVQGPGGGLLTSHSLAFAGGSSCTWGSSTSSAGTQTTFPSRHNGTGSPCCLASSSALRVARTIAACVPAMSWFLSDQLIMFRLPSSPSWPIAAHAIWDINTDQFVRHCFNIIRASFLASTSFPWTRIGGNGTLPSDRIVACFSFPFCH